MGITRSTRKQISGEAIEWFLQLQEPGGVGPNGQAFSEWLLRSPAHVEEYLQVACSWCRVNVGAEGDFAADELIATAKQFHEADNVVSYPQRFGLRPALENRGSGRRYSRRDWTKAMAASLVLGSALSAAYMIWNSPMTFATSVGEQRSFTLQDGSVVFLNTNSKVRVNWLSTERHIDLVGGEARFMVAKDVTRPFTVSTATAAIRDLGTVFNVRADPLSTQVAVLEGHVDVTAAPAQALRAEPQTSAGGGTTVVLTHAPSHVQLAAGERAAVTSGGIETNTGPPIESVKAWTERRLVFQDQPLNVVIREFNRYRTQPLVLDDPELAGLKISGVFDLSDPESLVAYLGGFETVQVDRRSDGSQHLFRGPAGVHSKQ